MDNIGLLASQNQLLAYFIIYIGIVFVGNVTSFASFWLVFRGYFGPFGVPMLLFIVFCADLTGDVFWFSLGRATRNTRFGNWIRGRLPKWHDRVEQAFATNGRKWIILSKFIYSAAFPVIFSAGWSRMTFDRFIRHSLVSILAWLPVLLGLAYGLFSGLAPLAALSAFHDFELLFLVGLAAFVVLDYFLSKIMGRIFQDGNGGEHAEH